MTNLFRDLDEDIRRFVLREENVALRPGTGRYSTLFRGTLFGSTSGSAITDQLRTTRVKVLVLGSNPNVPCSLCALRGVKGVDHFTSFTTQLELDHYGHVPESPGESGWDPATAPAWRRFMQGVIAPVCGTEGIGAVAMANFVPWGSKDFGTLLNPKLGVPDPGLLDRMLDQSAAWHARIVAELNPEIIVVPWSLASARRSGGPRRPGPPVLPELGEVNEVLPRQNIELPRGRVAIRAGRIPYGGQERTVAVLPHPSWFRYVASSAWPEVAGEMVRAIGSRSDAPGMSGNLPVSPSE